MTYNVHICTVGEHPEPSLEFLKHGMPIDKMYLLNSNDNFAYNRSEEEIRRQLKELNIDVETIIIDPLDFTQIYDCTLSIKDKEKSHDVRYYVNFTNGTRVMSAAVVSAAFLMNSEIYYVLNHNEHPELTSDQIIRHYRIFNFPEIGLLKGKYKQVFLLFRSRSEISNTVLKEDMGMNYSTLVTYTKKLKQWGLIDEKVIGREKYWQITEKGTSVLKRIYIPLTENKNYDILYPTK